MSSIVWLETWKTSSSRSSRTETVVKPLPRKREREVAASILIIAAALAGWIVFHRTSPPPKPELTVPRVVPEKASAQASQSAPQAQSSNTAIELVELPANFFEPPRPKTVATPTPLRTEPKSVEAKAPPPPVVKPVEEPPPVRVPEASPPPREEAHEIAMEKPIEKPIVPLKPEVRPELKHIEARVVPLRPEFPDIKSVIPLPPEEPKDVKVETSKPVVALQPEPSRMKPMSTLKPGDEKPVVKPVETPVPKPLVLRPVEEPPPVAIKEPVREAPKPVITPATTPAQKSRPAQLPPAPTIVADNPETAGEGRILLRLFEKGSGPGIEIRWPSDPGERDRLYDVFTRCLGMRDGIVDGDGRLFLPEGARAQPTALNTDRYSGFVRRPEGAIASDEQQEIARVRAYHQLGGSTSVARIFPRAIDAFLIGGLRQAVGDTYLNTKSVRAAYRLSGRRVIVDSIVADGRVVDGAIDITSVSSGCR